MKKNESSVYMIVGGTSGMGLSASKALVEDGNRVALLGRNPESLKIALAELGDSAIGLAGDGVDPKSTEALLKMTLKPGENLMAFITLLEEADAQRGWSCR